MSESESKRVTISEVVPSRSPQLADLAREMQALRSDSLSVSVAPARQRIVWSGKVWELAAQVVHEHAAAIAAGALSREGAFKQAAELYEKPNGNSFTVASLRNSLRQRREKEAGRPVEHSKTAR